MLKGRDLTPWKVTASLSLAPADVTLKALTMPRGRRVARATAFFLRSDVPHTPVPEYSSQVSTLRARVSVVLSDDTLTRPAMAGSASRTVPTTFRARILQEVWDGRRAVVGKLMMLSCYPRTGRQAGKAHQSGRAGEPPSFGAASAAASSTSTSSQRGWGRDPGAGIIGGFGAGRTEVQNNKRATGPRAAGENPACQTIL